MSRAFVFVLIVCTAALSCTSPDGGRCGGNVACTELFVAVTVQVSDSSGHSAALDSAYTVELSGGSRITSAGTFGGGIYTVLDDNYQQSLQNRSAELRFAGFRNGVQVVNELYTISADCCHVKKESGKKEVVVP